MAYDQQVTVYDDTTAQVRIIDDMIRIIDPVDTPLLAALGGLDGASSKFDIRQSGYKIELLEDTYAPTGGNLAAGGATVMTTNDTQFTVADATILQDGMVLKIDDDYMIVKSVDNTTNIMTIYETGYGGTNASHTSTAAFEIVGMARLEGDDADYVGLTSLSNPYNYTSIFQKGLNVSGSNEAVDYYGMGSPFAYQALKAMPELLVWVNRALYNGIRDLADATTPRSFGGLPTFITANGVNAAGQITESDVIEVAQAVFKDGGSADILVVNDEVAKDLHQLYNNSSFLRVDESGTSVGRPPITRVVTQFGTFRLVVDRWCPLATAYLLDSSKVGVWTMRPFGWKALAVTGDSKKGEVLGELSFLVANAAGMGYIYGLT